MIGNKRWKYNMKTDELERGVYSLIASGDGIRAKEIARRLHIDRRTVNRYLYHSPYMRDLCYQDRDYRWHALIGQGYPHRGLSDYSGYYGTVKEFLQLTEEEWFEMLLAGCRRIGRSGWYPSAMSCPATGSLCGREI